MPRNRSAFSSIDGERQYFHSRLADPWLLEQAVVVTYGTRKSGWWADLAVPVGGSRKSGGVSVSTSKEGQQVLLQLTPYPTLFPNLWLIPHGPDYMANVCWGTAHPLVPENAREEEWAAYDRAMGRLYGYREAIIDQFIWKKYRLSPEVSRS